MTRATHQIVTAREIAADLGVDRRTVYRWIERYPDFPQPVREHPIAMWDLEAVREWERATAPQRVAGRPKGT